MAKGIIERFKSMPISRPAFIIGQTFGGLIRSVIAVSVAAALAFLMGYRYSSGLAGLLGTAGLLMLFALALTSLAVVLGLLAASVDSAGTYGLILMFLPYFTGAFVPIYTMPKALQVFCAYQPVNVVWEAVSGLMSGNAYADVLSAILWCGGIALVSFATGGIIFTRKTSLRG
jgi:ABC-2 type transport system permease protein